MRFYQTYIIFSMLGNALKRLIDNNFHLPYMNADSAKKRAEGDLARGDAGTNPSHLALIHPGNEASPLALRAQPGRKEQRWFLPVSATLLRSYRCAVSRDERHCAATAARSAETKGKGGSLHFVDPTHQMVIDRPVVHTRHQSV